MKKEEKLSLRAKRSNLVTSSQGKAWAAKSRVALLAMTLLCTSGDVFASSDAKHPRSVQWPFDGMFGTLDRQSAQRGFQVYKEVCAACHGIDRVAFRNLTEIGFSEAEVKALAATYKIKDGPNDSGDMFERDGLAKDYFPNPFPNPQAAGAGFNGKAPPDLSLIVKARPDGANYLYSLLTGYGQTPHEGIVLTEGTHYNPYFAGGAIVMPAPLSDDQVTYQDGTKASVDQMARDVTTFLQWAAEPEMEARKQMGIKVLIYLVIFTGFMYVAKRNLWKKLH